jgi:hypothetical protein
MAQYHVDAGKKGWLATKDKLFLRFERARKAYDQNPKRCKHCGKIIPYEIKRQDYCNRRCWNDYRWGDRTNIQRIPSGKPKNKKCITCGSPCLRKFCSKKCERMYKFKVKAMHNVDMKRCTVKQHLLDIGRPRKCSGCGLTEWMGKPIPLETHHIDGDHTNNSDKNLALMCSNCHALTPTYKGKNNGHGRIYRRVMQRTET